MSGVDLRRIAGGIGITTIIVGVFSPLMYGSKYTEIKSFWSWGGGFDWGENWIPVIVTVTTILAVSFICKKWYRWLFPIGAIYLYLIHRTYVEFHQIRDASLARGNEFARAVQDIGLSWGLWVMAAGALLLVVTSVLPTSPVSQKACSE